MLNHKTTLAQRLIKEAIWIILSTSKGERVMRPDFGCGIHDYVFSAINITNIGYSFRDINIRYLFHKLTKLWRAAGGAEGRPTSYVFLSRPNPVQDRVLRSHSINPIFSELDSPQRGLEKFLMDLYRKVRD